MSRFWVKVSKTIDIEEINWPTSANSTRSDRLYDCKINTIFITILHPKLGNNDTSTISFFPSQKRKSQPFDRILKIFFQRNSIELILIHWNSNLIIRRDELFWVELIEGME